MAVVGTGGGSKPQVAAMVARILRRESLEVPEDATDALALALAQARALEQEARLGGDGRLLVPGAKPPMGA